MPSKNLLFIASHLPSIKVPQAGQRNAFKNLMKYKGEFNIYLVAFVNESELGHYNDEDYRFCEQVIVSHVTKWSRIRNIVRHPLLPVDAAMRCDRRISRILRELIDEITFDSVHMEYTSAAWYSGVLARVRHKTLFERDVTFQRVNRKAAASRGLARLFYKFEAYRQRVWEMEAVRNFDAVLVPSRKDKELLVAQGLDDSKITVRTCEIDDAYRRVSRRTIRRNSLLFWGAMDRNENIDGIVWFLKDMFPAVKERFPDSTVYIVGANPPEKLRRGRSESVIVTGFVDDPVKYFELAHICIVPLRLGAGLKVKVLEALSAGLTVISTEVGAEGIEDEKLLVAQDAGEFIELILEGLRNPW